MCNKKKAEIIEHFFLDLWSHETSAFADKLEWNVKKQESIFKYKRVDPNTPEQGSTL